MTLAHSLFVEVATPFRTFDQHLEWMQITGNHDYQERTEDGRRIARATELRTPSKKVPFEDRPCPICGSFGCWGC